jgi:hypothetical protein
MAAFDLVAPREATIDDWMSEGSCGGMTHLFFAPAAERPRIDNDAWPEYLDAASDTFAGDVCLGPYN